MKKTRYIFNGKKDKGDNGYYGWLYDSHYS